MARLFVLLSAVWLSCAPPMPTGGQSARELGGLEDLIQAELGFAFETCMGNGFSEEYIQGRFLEVIDVALAGASPVLPGEALAYECLRLTTDAAFTEQECAECHQIILGVAYLVADQASLAFTGYGLDY